ncbi:MAG: threonylcarbamoyl-AMP synthase [Kiritimatiellae bacterium]|nr:threonylcarbamoyl-AMP synthase [Kiritimatiellia bacterium]
MLAIQEDFARKNQSALPQQIGQAASILRNGGVVAFPTETVYGLGANALDAAAVAQIFEVKRRPRFDPLIVHVSDFQQAESLVANFPANARELARCFWSGPLTLVLPKSDQVPDIVTAGLSTVAVRMPDHPVALALIRAAGVPLAAPSANPFGYISPTTADHVREQFGNSIAWILDGGACKVGIESTVISFADDPPSLLRPGGLPLKDIERIAGPVKSLLKPQTAPLCPGQLPRHYAPRTPLVLWTVGGPNPSGGRTGLLSLKPPENKDGFSAVEVLSSTGDLREAAANLFAALRRLDALSLDIIMFQPVPEDGLGLAIMDRLLRASLGGVQKEGGT